MRPTRFCRAFWPISIARLYRLMAAPGITPELNRRGGGGRYRHFNRFIDILLTAFQTIKPFVGSLKRLNI
jgi:hypothetical protein